MTDPARPEAVVFDFDGLMVNTEELYDDVGSEVLRRRGKRFTGDLKDKMMGRPGYVALQIMIDWHGLTDTVEQLQAESEQVFDSILPKRLAPMPGLLELLSALQTAGIRRAIATSSRRRFVEQALSLLNVATPFEFVLSAENVQRGKPDPEIYQTAARVLGLPPARMLVLEDSENGCRAAVAAGTYAVAVPSLHSRHHDFAGVILVADSLADRRIYAALGL